MRPKLIAVPLLLLPNARYAVAARRIPETRVDPPAEAELRRYAQHFDAGFRCWTAGVASHKRFGSGGDFIVSARLAEWDDVE